MAWGVGRAEMPGNPTCHVCGSALGLGASACGSCGAAAPGMPAETAKLGDLVPLPAAASAAPAPTVQEEEGAEIETHSFVMPEQAEQAVQRASRAGRLRSRFTRRSAAEPVAEPELEAVPEAEVHVPRGVSVVCSIDRGLRPEPGAQQGPYLWQDLFSGEAPPRRSRGEGTYVVYHAIEVDADIRITYQTIVSTKRQPPTRGQAEGELHLTVDDRTSVQKRALLEMMDAARSRADQRARRSREALAVRLARGRRAVLAWPRSFAKLGFALLHLEATVGTGLLKTRRRVLRGLVEVPDALASGALRVESHLSTRLGRQGLWAGIKDPASLSTEQRSVTLFLTAVLLGLSVLLLNSFFALALPEFATAYRLVLIDATAQFISVFGFPLPVEVPLIQQTVEGMGLLAFVGFMFGKMLGVWVLYLLGDSLHAKLEHHTKNSPRMQRGVTWLRANANRYGFPILFIDNAVPLMPDQVLLVFAVSGIKFRTWMWSIGLATALKFAVVIAGVYLIGPERIHHIFNPFG